MKKLILLAALILVGCQGTDPTNDLRTVTLKVQVHAGGIYCPVQVTYALDGVHSQSSLPVYEWSRTFKARQGERIALNASGCTGGYYEAWIYVDGVQAAHGEATELRNYWHVSIRTTV